MTTHVPDGTSDASVQDIRTREGTHSRELAAQGHLLRLWRPPLRAGEWRTLGLFAAADSAEIEEVLASMPLRVWRSDEVTSLSPHPNDPVRSTDKLGPSGRREFLTTFAVTVPAGTPDEAVDATKAREADRARELAAEGHLSRLWKLAGEDHALGLWKAQDIAEMEAIVESLPLNDWMLVRTTPLDPHPSDPALISG